ncbi:MAG TPA: sulfatase-like hydrolase/transferase [Vicinamibacteria bacterium]|nr:sulfatase-like hydrolase/transferase [Vicinamibacteria bacterium]
MVALVAVAGWRLGRHTERPNLLLVTIDTLRADRVGAYGYAAAATPNLDRLAAGGVRFENAQAAVPLTGPSHATIFTGQYPPVHGVRDNVAFRLGTQHPTLAGLLRDRGYRTAAVVGAFPVASGFGFGQGFDHFSEELHESPAGGQGAERPAREVADAALEWLSKPGRGPFFLWVHFYDPHDPYTPPAPFRERFADRPYDGEVAYADAELGRILEAVGASGEEDRTLVVALADHGEGLGEHGESTHALLLYESTLRVPFIAAGPGVPAGRVVRARVGAVDVLPTVLGLMGMPTPAGLPGRDLRAALDEGAPTRQPLYAESLFGRLNCRWAALRSWTDGDFKLVVGGEPELFDLRSDPGEQRNLARELPRRVTDMRAALEAAVRRMSPGGDAAHASRLSPEQEERLRSLGYAGAAASSAALDEPGLPDPRQHVRVYERLQAASLARGPELPAAVAEAAAIARLDPGNPFAHMTVAALAYRAGRLSQAADAYARAVELDPERAATRLSYGRLLRELGRLRESERQLRIALEHTTDDDVRTRVALAETLTELGRTEEARSLLDPVLEREPRHSEALLASGRLLVAEDRAREAIAPLERAAKAGRDPQRWVELARVHLSLGDPRGAQSAAARALQLNPVHPWALAVKGHALILEGRKEPGMAALHEALARRPRRAEAWLSLAAGFEAAGETAAAARCRREARAVAQS